MLSIAKLRVGQEAYQLSGVAQSLDDYYTGAGEAHGQWIGGGASRLGLDGQVAADDLRAVLAGLRPGTGGLTPNGEELRTHPRRVPGFDLTFKAPKSASVLYAVSDDPRVQGAVIDAGEAAMRAAIGWLERQAAQVQRGSHNMAYLERLTPPDRKQAGPHRLKTNGLVAASFRHRTSRAGDPLLHWHVLVANLAEGTDNRWTSLVHPELYHHARAAGEIFQTVYRDELTRTLGVEWRPGRHVPEIAGIPQQVLDAFSKRSTEIDAWLAATGTADTIEGRQAAVLATRRHKPEREHQRLDTAWKIEADDLGWGPLEADGLIAASSRHAGIDYDNAWRLETVGFDEHGSVDVFERTVSADEWITDLLRKDLTADNSTFTLAQLTQAVAHRLGDGATLDTIERLARRVIASPHVVSVANPDTHTWTSRELLEVEQAFIDTLACPASIGLHGDVIRAAVADRPTLGHDQRHATETICRSTSAVSVLVGPAGTGKTYTIDTIRAAHQASGHRVYGTAPSARAALELAAATGIETTTLHRLLANGYLHDIAPGDLLVIDEAGMADIRTLTQAVTRHTAAGGHVLLVGDHHQLPEIGAGGGFAYAANHASTIAELTVNRRQREEWEQAALTELRDGNVADAVTAYLDQQRVTVTPTPHHLIAEAITMWAQARASGANPVLLAGTNDLVNQLNQAAIQHLIATGELSDTAPSPYGETAVRVGERVVLRRNSRLEATADGDTLTVANGQSGVVVAVNGDRIAVSIDGGATVALDTTYLEHGGHLTHAYALTSHRAQGGTWDLAIAVGADTLYREAAYVQLSRGTHSNHLILTDPEVTRLITESGRETPDHATGITPSDEQPDDAAAYLVQRLTRSALKALAHALDPDIDQVNQLAATHRYSDLESLAHDARYAEHVATTTHGTTRDDLHDKLERLTQIGQCITTGLRVSPSDRHNVGTVTAVDDLAGRATVEFVSASGNHATRTFGWDELRFVEPHEPPPRSLDDTARTTLDRLRSQLADTIDAWDATLQAFAFHPGDARRYAAAANRQIEHAAASLAADQPTWLANLLGSRPTDIAGARTWDNAVTAAARHELQDTHNPQADAQLAVWLRQTKQWLDTNARHTPAAEIQRNPIDINERREQLHDIFAAAPADCRRLIAELQSGQLTLVDTQQLLHDALTQQDARREWILEHWPHVVEYAELDRFEAQRAMSTIDL